MYAQIQGNEVISPSGKRYPHDCVIIDGYRQYGAAVARHMLEESYDGTIPSWVTYALDCWNVNYAFYFPEQGIWNDSYPLTSNDWASVSITAVHGRAVQYERYCHINQRVSGYAVRIYAADLIDPGVARQFHLLYKDGRREPISFEDAYDHLGTRLDEYTFVYDPESISPARLDYQNPTKAFLRARQSSKLSLTLKAQWAEEDKDENYK